MFVGSLFSCLRGLLTYFDVERRGVLLCFAWESSWDDGEGWAFSVDYEARISSGGSTAVNGLIVKRYTGGERQSGTITSSPRELLCRRW